MLPNIIFKIDVWDVGAILLLISAIQLYIKKPIAKPVKGAYLTFLRLFLAWLCICLIWSLLIFKYPLIDTIKSSRQMIIGYLSIFIFIRLLRVDPGALDFLIALLYWLTFGLMIICLLQYLSHTHILFIRATKYGNTYRLIPTFLPICLLFLWIITSKFICGAKVKWHEIFYLFLVASVTSITFTRGIYLSVAATFLLLILTLLMNGKLVFNRLVVFFSCLLFFLSVLALSGALDRVIDRAISGIMLITGSENNATLHWNTKDNYDTFSGRIATTIERIKLTYERNPFVGYGFIHEDNVSTSLRSSLKFGSVIDTEKYRNFYEINPFFVLALFTADIGWANLFVYSGAIGFALVIFFLFSFVISFVKTKNLKTDKYYFIRLGTFFQVLVSALLMFNGTPLTKLIQIPAFMIAGYAFCTSIAPCMPSNNEVL